MRLITAGPFTGGSRLGGRSFTMPNWCENLLVVWSGGWNEAGEREVYDKADEGISVMLVGSKADIDPDAREVPSDEAQGFANEKGWLYFETSAKLGLHVRDAFYLLACTVMNNLLERDPKNLINTPKLTQTPPSKMAACCS